MNIIIRNTTKSVKELSNNELLELKGELERKLFPAYSAEELSKLFPDIDDTSEQQGNGDEEPNNDETAHDESEATPQPVLAALGQYFTQLKDTLTEVHHE